MFEFLGTLGSLANTAGQVAGPLQSILSIFRGGGNNEEERFVPESERYAKSLLMALAQPGNSMVQSLEDEELRKLKAGQGGDIMAKVLADRREAAMGRAPVFFDPERRDENIAHQLSRGTPMLMQQANQNAVQRILKAAGVKEFAKPEALREQAYQETLLKRGSQPPADPFTSMNGNLKKILEAFNRSPSFNPAYRPPGAGANTYGPFNPTDYTSSGEQIRWNQMRY